MMKETRLNLSHLTMGVLIAFAIALAGLLSADKQFIFMEKPDMCGIYCKMAINYGDYLSNRLFDTYFIQKSLFSFIAYVFMTLGGLERTPIMANAILERISALLLVGSAFLWYGIARYHALSRSAYWVGFFGIFFCQIFVKLIPYAQEWPDTGALFFGLAGLYAVTCARQKWILPIYVVSLFVQPQFKIFLIPIIILSYEASPKIALPSGFERLRARGRSLCEKAKASPYGGKALIFAAYMCVFAVIGYVFPRIVKPAYGAHNTIQTLLPLSILSASLFFTYFLSKMDLFGVMESVLKRMEDRLFWKRVGQIVCIEVIAKLVIAIFAHGEALAATSTTIGPVLAFVNFYYQSIEQPMKFIVAPTVFFGPVFVLFALSLRKVKADAPKFFNPLAFSSAALLLLFLFPDTESRHYIAYVPWFLLLVLSGERFSPAFFVLFASLSVLFSRFFAAYAPVGPEADPYLMTWGPWYTREIYWKSVVVSIALFLVIWAGKKYLRVKHEH